MTGDGLQQGGPLDRLTKVLRTARAKTSRHGFLPGVRGQSQDGNGPRPSSSLRLAMARVASSPSITGICRSMRIRSARWESLFRQRSCRFRPPPDRCRNSSDTPAPTARCTRNLRPEDRGNFLWTAGLLRADLPGPRRRRSPELPSRREWQMAPPDRTYFPPQFANATELSTHELSEALADG